MSVDDVRAVRDRHRVERVWPKPVRLDQPRRASLTARHLDLALEGDRLVTEAGQTAMRLACAYQPCEIGDGHVRRRRTFERPPAQPSLTAVVRLRHPTDAGRAIDLEARDDDLEPFVVVGDDRAVDDPHWRPLREELVPSAVESWCRADAKPVGSGDRRTELRIGGIDRDVTNDEPRTALEARREIGRRSC